MVSAGVRPSALPLSPTTRGAGAGREANEVTVTYRKYGVPPWAVSSGTPSAGVIPVTVNIAGDPFAANAFAGNTALCPNVRAVPGDERAG